MHRLLFQESAGPQGEDLGEEGSEERKYYILHRSDSCGILAVAEEQNVSRAAKRLHVLQPPLSRQIRDLETEMGGALFERSVKAIRLTEAGKIFLLEAREALQRADDAVALAKSVANQKRNQVHVGYSVPPLLRSFPALFGHSSAQIRR